MKHSLKEAQIGQNKYCGPAVLSIITGKSSDYCANVISGINGSYTVQGVTLQDLMSAANKMGFDCTPMPAYTGSMYRTIVNIVSMNEDGIYILMPPHHYVVVEVRDKKAYFCDNHTKQVIPAASSARLLQNIERVIKVIKRPVKEVEPSYKYYETKVCNYCLATWHNDVGGEHRDYCKYKQYLDFKREEEATNEANRESEV